MIASSRATEFRVLKVRLQDAVAVLMSAQRTVAGLEIAVAACTYRQVVSRHKCLHRGCAGKEPVYTGGR